MKFQIGDTICVKGLYGFRYESCVNGSVILYIINDDKEIHGNWCNGSRCEFVSQCYVAKTKDGVMWTISFDDEDHFESIGSSMEFEIKTCSRCGDKMKEYDVVGLLAGSTYHGHKCPNCGYCK